MTPTLRQKLGRTYFTLFRKGNKVDKHQITEKEYSVISEGKPENQPKKEGWDWVFSGDTFLVDTESGLLLYGDYIIEDGVAYIGQKDGGIIDCKPEEINNIKINNIKKWR